MAMITGSRTIDRDTGREISHTRYDRNESRDSERAERVAKAKQNYGRIDSSTGGYAEYEGTLNDAAGLSHNEVLAGKSYRDYERKESESRTSSFNVAKKPNTVATPSLNPSPSPFSGYSRQGSRISHSVQTSRSLLGSRTHRGNPYGLFGQGLADIRKNATPLDSTAKANGLFQASTSKFSPAGTPQEVEAWDKQKKLEFDVAKRWLDNEQAELIGDFTGNIITNFAPPLIPVKSLGTATVNMALNNGISHAGGILKWAKERGQFDRLGQTEKEQAETYYQHLDDELKKVKQNRSGWEKAARFGANFVPFIGDFGTTYADHQEVKQTLAKQNNPYIDAHLDKQTKAIREAQIEDEKRRKEDRGERNSTGILPTMKQHAHTEHQPQANAYHADYVIPGIENLWNINVIGYDYSKYLNK